MVFRRHVTLPSSWFHDEQQPPRHPRIELQAKIAVDSKYWLWAAWHSGDSYQQEDDDRIFTLTDGIDESLLLVREGGLKRGPTPTDTWYDPVRLDIPHHSAECVQDVEQSDVNMTLSIQVLVWYFGKEGKDSGHGGLIIDGTVREITDGRQSKSSGSIALATDEHWLVMPHPAFSTKPPSQDHRPNPNYRLPEHNIHFDARNLLHLHNNKQLKWKHSATLGQAGSKPWNQLWKRTIPQWRDYPLKNYSHGQTQQLTQSTDSDHHSKTIMLQARLPYNMQFYPWIELPEIVSNKSCYSTIQVDIQTDNYQYYKPKNHKSGDPTYLRATYITHALDAPQSFESPSWINGHVVTYSITYYNLTGNPPLPVIKYRETSYNTDLKGKFHCNDNSLNTLWSKAQRTLLVNMRDNFMDCPDRERAQWWGDVTLELGQVMYALEGSSAHRLIQKAISDLIHWQQRNDPHQHPSNCHKLHAPVPEGNYPKELPLQMLASIGWYGIYAYYWYTGDTETVKAAYPHIQSYLKTCWSMNMGSGLINHRHGDWDWKDWGENYDGPILDSTWYVLVLRAAIEMATVANSTQDVDIWKSQLDSIQNKFDAAFWTGDSYQSKAQRTANQPADDRSNALAVVAGLVPQERFPQVAKVLTTQHWSSPYMEKYVLESLFLMDRGDEALQRMKTRYDAMVAMHNITTLWEEWDLGFGSYNHAWSGGPLTLLSQYVVGVAPSSPGWGTYNILPQDSFALTRVQATVPVVIYGKNDMIRVSIQKREAGQGCTYVLDLLSPDGTMATIGIPRGIKLEGRICRLRAVTTNNNLLWSTVDAQGKGDGPSIEGIEFKELKEDYVSWQVEPGSWNFQGTADCGSRETSFGSGLE